MPHDSDLSRISRDVLMAAAGVLAVVTPLTHLAQSFGWSFRGYALAGFAVAVASLAVCIARAVRGPREQPFGWRPAAPLIAICALSALLPLVVQHATADDAVYLPSVVHSLAHPANAMSFEVRYAWFGEPLVESAHWNVATPFDYAEGALAWVTGVPLLDVRYLVAPALIAGLLPLAVFFMLTRFGFRDTAALTGCLLFGAVLLLMRETEHTPGAVALLRTYQGKFVALAIGTPVFVGLTMDLARAPGWARFGRLFVVAPAIAGCGSSAVLLLGLLAPLVVMAAAVALAEDRRAALRTVAFGATSLAYPAFVAVWALASAGASLGSDAPIHGLYARSFGPNAAWVFAGPATIGLSAVTCAAACARLRGRERRFMALWTGGAVMLLLNPVVAPLVIEHVTTPNLYWRVFYVAPLQPLIALGCAGIADRLERWRPQRAGAALGAILAVLLLLQVPAQMNGLYRRSQLVHPFPDSDRCLNRVVAAQARFLVESAPPGPMLGPPYLSRIVPLVGADHPQLAHQEESLLLWAPEEAAVRMEAARCLSGVTPESAETVAEVLRLHPEVVAVVAFPEAVTRPELLLVLERAGLEPADDEGPDVVLFVRRP